MTPTTTKLAAATFDGRVSRARGVAVKLERAWDIVCWLLSAIWLPTFAAFWFAAMFSPSTPDTAHGRVYFTIEHGRRVYYQKWLYDYVSFFERHFVLIVWIILAVISVRIVLFGASTALKTLEGDLERMRPR